MTRHLIIIIIIFSMVSCQNNRRASVTFLKGDISFIHSITLEEMQKESRALEYTDTVYVPSTFFEDIDKMMETKIYKERSVDSCILFEMDSLCFSVNRFNNADIRSQKENGIYILDERACYELRKTVGFYNHWSDLDSSLEIDKYGIPDNYHYIPNKYPDDIYKKILIIEDKRMK